MAARTTRKMSDRHEDDIVAVLGGERTRNSGAVWSDQGDVHQTGLDQHWKFGMDGKSTLGGSISINREMLAKIREQCRGLEPALPLRWYRDDRLTMVDEDWITLELDTFAQILDDANAYRRIKEAGCLDGVHDFAEQESSAVPGMMVKNGSCRGCGRSPAEAVTYSEMDLADG